MSTACPPAITKQSLSDHDARIVLNSSGGGMKGKSAVAMNRGGENLKISPCSASALSMGLEVADEAQKRPVYGRPSGHCTSQSYRLLC